MEIWLIKSHEPLPLNKHGDRLFRTGVFFKILKKNGHNVKWFISSFNHFRKEQNIDPSFAEIIVLKTPGYKNNKSFKRFYDHFIVGIKFLRYALRSKKKPDIIICALPIFSNGLSTLIYSKLKGVDYYIDYRDHFPEVLWDRSSGWKKILLKIFSFHYQLLTKLILNEAKGIISISENFLALALQKIGREFNSQKDLVVHMPYEPIYKLNPNNIRKEIREFFKTNDAIYLTFIGTVGHLISDLETIYEGINNANKQLEVKKLKLIVCGEGDKLNEFKKFESNNIFHTGFLAQQEISFILNKSDIGLMPYANTTMWQNTIPNKFIEYLSSGLYLCTSLSKGLVFDLISKNRLGANYIEGDSLNFAMNISAINIDSIRKTRKERKDFFEENFSLDVTKKKLELLIKKNEP